MQMRGRISIRRERGSSAPGDPLNPHRPRSRTIEPWILEAAEGSTLQRLERAYLDALAAVDAVEDRRAASSKSGKFTSQGITDDALQFAASTCAPKLRRARQTLEAAKQEVAERRAKLTLKGPDKSDAATQILRLWKLDKFNALPDATRNAAMADAVSLDPDLAAAILQAPAYSNILPSDLGRLRDHALKAQHGEKAIDALGELEAGIAIVDQVLPLARAAIAEDVGGEAALATAAEPYERAATAPFLQKCKRYETDPKAGHPFVRVKEEYIGVWKEGIGFRPATEAEIANGVYYENYAAYQAAQNGDLSGVPQKTNGAASEG